MHWSITDRRVDIAVTDLIRCLDVSRTSKKISMIQLSRRFRTGRNGGGCMALRYIYAPCNAKQAVSDVVVLPKN